MHGAKRDGVVVAGEAVCGLFENVVCACVLWVVIREDGEVSCAVLLFEPEASCPSATRSTGAIEQS